MSEWIRAKAMTRDDVIKALECCTSGKIEECLNCPVEAQSELPTHYCITVLLCEALALLKEKPRPLSLDDVLQIYHALDDHVWPYNTPPYLWCEVNRKMYDAFPGWVTWREVMSIIERMVTLRPYSIDNYGELWVLYMRCPDKKREEKEDGKCET